MPAPAQFRAMRKLLLRLNRVRHEELRLTHHDLAHQAQRVVHLITTIVHDARLAMQVHIGVADPQKVWRRLLR